MLSNGPLFVRRDKAHRTTASFCRRCFMTVASSQLEADLERAERNHKCDPIELEYLNGMLSQKSGQKSRNDQREGR
jgi:hypothetical protein